MSEANTNMPADQAAEAEVTKSAAPPVRVAGLISGLEPRLAIVVAIIASLISGFLWWQYRQFYVELANDDALLQQDLEDTRSNVRRLEDQIVALRGELGASASTVDRLSGDLEVLPPELRALSRRVEALQGGRLNARDSWLREQAEYYLVLANSELNLAGRIGSAVSALELADDVLRELADPGLADVRAAIAAERQSLNAIEVPDVEGLAADLDSLIERAVDLPMRAASPDNFGVDEQDLDAVEPGLGRLWASTKGAVFSIVRIERQEEPVGPVLTEAERRVARRQFALELQLARIALLERRQQDFRSSLVTADGILNRDFDRGAQSVVDARRLLGEMARIELAPRLPAISDSLSLLRTLPGAQ
jgi:uncharacterized protein HemX